MNPGEIYWAEYPDTGPRPVIVISRAELNRGNRVQVVPVTTRHFEKRSRLPTCVMFRAGEFCFTEACVAQCDLSGPIPITAICDIDAGPVDHLSDEVFRAIVAALGYVMDSICEPN